MSKLRRWLPSILGLLAVWAGIALCVQIVSSGKSTVAATLALLQLKPSAADTEAARHAWIASFSARLAVLDLDARHRCLMDARLRSAFSEMPAEDQEFFLQSVATLRWQEFVQGTKGWSAGRYERLLQPALADLEELLPGSGARLQALLADPLEWRPRSAGIKSIFKDATPLAQFDALPLAERIQKYSQRGR